MTQPVILMDIPLQFGWPGQFGGTDDLVGELFDAGRLARLEALGRVVRTDGAATDEQRWGADVVITGWGSRGFPETPPAGARLGLIAHSAGTVRHLTPRALIEAGVGVSQATQALSASVAELALTLTLLLRRGVLGVNAHLHATRDWTFPTPVVLPGTLADAVVGVVGASRIGRLYLGLLKPFGPRVLVYDPYVSAAEAVSLGVEPVSLEELMARSDVVALHAPVTDATRGLISRERLALLRDGAGLVNTARSAILDSAALEDELVAGRISAALDVFDAEPVPADSRLYGLPNVILTPHYAGHTTTARAHQGEIVVSEIERHLAGEPRLHAVTAENYERLA